MSFTGAATQVVARLFRLLNPKGQDVLDISTDNPYGGITSSSSFNMHHLSPPFTDSLLSWDTDPTVTDPSVALFGPHIAGTTFSPYLQLQGTATQAGTWINAENATGGLAGTSHVASTTVDSAAIHSEARNELNTKWSHLDMTVSNITANTYDGSAIVIDAVGSAILSGTSVAQITAPNVNLAPTTQLEVNSRQAQMLVDLTYAKSTGPLALTATQTVITGCSITKNLNIGDEVHILAIGNFNCTVAGGGVAKIIVNGVFIDGDAQFTAPTAGTIVSSVMQYVYTIPSTGAYTFALEAAQSAGTWTALINRCSITCTTFATK